MVNVLAAVCTVDPNLVNLARAFKARRAQIFWKIEFPSSLPPLFAGLRIGSTLPAVGVGDAAHALSPNIGQAGGFMKNALSLGVHLDRRYAAALAAWERQEGPITDHTHRISVLLGLPTIWPPPLRTVTLAALAGRSKWLTSSAPVLLCTARPGRDYQNGIVMPSIGASQLTRSTRFQAIRTPSSLCTRRWSAVPPKMR